MALNIKNERVHAIATQLAELTGETLTGVILVALEARLQNELKRRGKPKAEQILEFASRFAIGVDPNLKSADHAIFLYGEDGLPL